MAKIPSSTVHKHQMIPQSPQHNLPRSISDPPNLYPPYTGVHGVAMPPHHSASLGHPQNQFVATPYPAALTPMSPVPYNNFGQPATYGPAPARPTNGLGNQILGNVANGIASGIAQATAQAMIQGFTGGGGGGNVGAGGGVVDATGSGSAGMTDAALYVDGGYGGTDVGYDAGAGDVSYY